MAKITAVIDIGSNSARVAIFQKSSRFGFHLIKEIKSRVRISEDSYENEGYLQPLPMERAFKAIREFVAISKRFGARKILCVATSAMRDAPNGRELVNRVEKEIGINIKVIDGQKEAFYGAVAASNLLHAQDGVTVDIGGGSTDCALIRSGKIEQLFTLDIGTIRLKELFFDKKRPLSEAIAFVQKELEKIPAEIKKENIIGIGGTARSLSKSIMKNEEYAIDLIHGYTYDAKKNLEHIERIVKSEVMKLKKFSIKQDRIDTIRGGALIFLEMLKRLDSEKVITSGVGVREGVFLSDMLRGQNYRFPPNFNPSVRSLMDRFGHDNNYAVVQQKLALELFEVLKPKHGLDDGYKLHLKTAARLSDIGISLSFYEHHHHSRYFLLNALNYGFSHRDRAIIALLVEYQNKKIPKDKAIEELREILPPIEELQWLSFILGLAEVLNSNMISKKIQFRYINNVLYIESDEELYLAKEEAKNLAKPSPIALIFKKDIVA